MGLMWRAPGLTLVCDDEVYQAPKSSDVVAHAFHQRFVLLWGSVIQALLPSADNRATTESAKIIR